MPDEGEVAVRQLFDPEMFSSLLMQVSSDEGFPELLSELRAVMHTLIETTFVPDPDADAAVVALSQFVLALNDWSLSYQLTKSPIWRKQMEESQKELDAGGYGQPIPASGVRAALSK